VTRQTKTCRECKIARKFHHAERNQTEELHIARMTIKAPIDERHPLCGTWIASSEDTDDYFRSQYSITALDGEFRVTGIDCGDGEQFVISDVQWDGEWLTFKSFMPSTKRRGVNRMRFIDTHEIEFLFTFTVREIWRRKHVA
jgi:hypothetical protein